MLEMPLNDHLYLPPGGLYAGPHCVIDALVGSCVAVTMWSPRALVGGMNHYVLPAQPGGTERSPRYGETALAMLLARMKVLGVDAPDIEARIFGGAAVLAGDATDTGLGEQNVLAAWAFLRRNGVRIIDEQCGGKVARRISLDVRDGSVTVTVI